MIDRDHAVFLAAVGLAFGHLADLVLTVGVPPEETFRLSFFVAITLAAAILYPRLGEWRGPLAIVFGIGWAFEGLTAHIADLAAGRGGPADISGIAEFAAGLLAIGSGAFLTRGVLSGHLRGTRKEQR